jgi:hypothetical protein
VHETQRWQTDFVPVDKAAPQATGPYVVIKLGKQALKTKKVENTLWGEC